MLPSLLDHCTCQLPRSRLQKEEVPCLRRVGSVALFVLVTLELERRFEPVVHRLAASGAPQKVYVKVFVNVHFGGSLAFMGSQCQEVLPQRLLGVVLSQGQFGRGGDWQGHPVVTRQTFTSPRCHSHPVSEHALRIVDLGDRSRPLLRLPSCLISFRLSPALRREGGSPGLEGLGGGGLCVEEWRRGPRQGPPPGSRGSAGVGRGARRGCCGMVRRPGWRGACCFLSVPPEPLWGLEPHSSNSATVEGHIH